MLVIMTIGTEIFPIGSIRWIIRMVAVFMVNGQQMQVGRIKFATALGTDPAVQFKGLLPVRFNSGAFRPHPADQFIGFFLGNCLYGTGPLGSA